MTVSRPGLAPLVLLLVGVLAPLVAAQGDGASADLDAHIAPGFELANATLFVGRMDLDVDGYRNPAFVHASRLVAAPVNVTVCPVEDPGDSVVRGLLLATPGCDGGETHFMPEVSFGPRTWLQFAGMYGARPAISGATTLFVPNGPFGGTTAVSVLGNGSFPFGYRDDQMRFQPLVSSSQVVVRTHDDRFVYNGTEWRFLFGGGGEATMRADGVHVSLGDRVPFRLAPMAPGELAAATRARVLLDLQETVLGADEREPVNNVTELFSLARSPVFLNGAVLGRINGTAGGQDLARESLAQVRYDALEAVLTTDRVVGSGEAQVVLVAAGVVVGDGPGSPPWVLAVVLWVGAALALFLGRAWTRPYRWVRWVDLAVPVVLFVLVDRVLAWRLGAGALGVLLGGDFALGVGLRLLVFALAATLALFLLVYLPLLIMGRRLVPVRWGVFAAPVAFVVAVVYLLLASADVIATAFAFVRL